jgi:formate dehydrogenase subunit delta
MNNDNLVKMANQISRFFEVWTDREAARGEVADHLVRFWDPRMRAALCAHLASRGQASGLCSLAQEAVATLPAVTPRG